MCPICPILCLISIMVSSNCCCRNHLSFHALWVLALLTTAGTTWVQCLGFDILCVVVLSNSCLHNVSNCIEFPGSQFPVMSFTSVFRHIIQPAGHKIECLYNCVRSDTFYIAIWTMLKAFWSCEVNAMGILHSFHYVSIPRNSSKSRGWNKLLYQLRGPEWWVSLITTIIRVVHVMNVGSCM